MRRLVLLIVLSALPALAQSGKYLELKPADGTFSSAGEFSGCIDLPDGMSGRAVPWESSFHVITAAPTCTFQVQYTNQTCEFAVDPTLGRWVNYFATDRTCTAASNEQLTRVQGTFKSMRLQFITLTGGTAQVLYQGSN